MTLNFITVMNAAFDGFRLYAEALGDLCEAHILHIFQPDCQRLLRRQRLQLREKLLVSELPLHLVRHIPLVLQRERINVLKGDPVAPQVVDIAVFCDRDQPCTEGCTASYVKPFDTADHFQEGFLCQIFGKHLVPRGFQEEAGSIVAVQPNQLVKRLSVAALTFFNHAFSFNAAPSFLISFGYTRDVQKGWRLNQHHQRSADDQHQSERRFFRQALLEYQSGEADGD